MDQGIDQARAELMTALPEGNSLKVDAQTEKGGAGGERRVKNVPALPALPLPVTACLLLQLPALPVQIPAPHATACLPMQLCTLPM